MARTTQDSPQRVYERGLAGGGYVAIEVMSVRNLVGQLKYHGHVIVERRTQPERREGHRAPSVASADAATISTLLHKLFPVAQSNAAVASGCLAQMAFRPAAKSSRA